MMNLTGQSHSKKNHNVSIRDLHLKDIVLHAMEDFLAHSAQKELKKGVIYDGILSEIEKGLLEAILNYTGGNESRAARLLGISRGTLRQRRSKFGHYRKIRYNA